MLNFPPLPDATAVERAAHSLDSVVRRTPVDFSERLSELAGRPVFLKREDMQRVRSYKLRGAYLFMMTLNRAAREEGVVAASAGNHAQGVAYACKALKIRGKIFVPTTTPRQKRERIKGHGGQWVELILVGETFDDAARAAAEESHRTGAALVPPFDDPVVMAGQGTVALEGIAQVRDEFGAEVSTLVAPVGGGGLLGGCLAYVCGRYQDVEVIGVEPASAASMAAAVRADEPVILSGIDSFVDGAAVRCVGSYSLAMVQRHSPRLVSVEEGAVCTQMLELYQVEGIIAEPAGALAPAAVALGSAGAGDGAILAIISGGNNDVSRYNEVVERSLVHEGLKHYFLVTFAQEPGALRRFLDDVLGPDDDITLFDYIKRNNREQGPALVGLEISKKDDLAPLLGRMERSHMRVEKIDPNDPMYRYLA